MTGYFNFDESFGELERFDPGNELSELKPEDFKADDIEQSNEEEKEMSPLPFDQYDRSNNQAGTFYSKKVDDLPSPDFNLADASEDNVLRATHFSDGDNIIAPRKSRI